MSEPEILVTRRIPDAGLDVLESECSVEVFEGEAPIPRETLKNDIEGKDGLLCLLSDPVDEEVMEAAGGSLKIISNYAVGYDNIDVEKATERDILVTNTPGVLREATADLSWALIMSAARRIPESDRFMRAGRYMGWGPKLLLGQDVYGKTIGIVGMGDIGGAVARRATGFDMKILYHNRSRNEEMEEELDAEYRSLEELLQESDFVALHVPLTGSTRHLLGESELDMMKENAILVNVARGEEDSVRRARRLRGGTGDVSRSDRAGQCRAYAPYRQRHLLHAGQDGGDGRRGHTGLYERRTAREPGQP